MNDRRAMIWLAPGPIGRWGLACLVAGALGATAAAAAPSRKAAAAPEMRTESSAAQALAKVIEAKLPPPTPGASSCSAATRIALRGDVEAVVAQAGPTRDLATAALKIVRDQSPQADPCRAAALDDSITELSGDGELVDDGEAVRGFVLYTGPMPPVRR